MPYGCTKHTCEDGTHIHVETLMTTKREIGALLWGYAGHTNIEKDLSEVGSLSKAVQESAARLRDPGHEGGHVLINDVDGEELSMEEYIEAYLKAGVGV
jgi:hypothetical protein